MPGDCECYAGRIDVLLQQQKVCVRTSIMRIAYLQFWGKW